MPYALIDINRVSNTATPISAIIEPEILFMATILLSRRFLLKWFTMKLSANHHAAAPRKTPETIIIRDMPDWLKSMLKPAKKAMKRKIDTGFVRASKKSDK